MKVLFLGDISPGQTSLMRARALRRLGYRVEAVNTTEPWRRLSWIGRQVYRRLQSGPVVSRLNKAILDVARAFQPNIVWSEKQEFLLPETITAVRDLGARLVHY